MLLKEQIKNRLKEKGMTAAQLSRETGVSKSVLSDWMAGVSPKNLQHLKLVAEVLDTCIDNLCFGVEKSRCTKCTVCGNPVRTCDKEEWITGTFDVKMRRVKK